MDHEVIKSSLDGLERKILMLLNERRALKEEIKSITIENQRLKVDMREKESKIAAHKNNAQISEIVGCVSAQREDSLELQKKVDAYIMEIDRCIAHLNL